MSKRSTWIVKVLLHFTQPFWDSGERSHATLPQLSFLFSDDDVMATWWTSAPLLTPTLTGWVGGPRATQWSTCTDAAIAKQAKDALARGFHLTLRQVEEQCVGYEFHNWTADPFSRGAYSYTRVGGLDAPQRLAEPVAGTLFFAGEATHHAGHSATVHGALATGQRAANEIVSQLSSHA
jgi:monoamine oxidase